uniref:MOSC domain-containing protein n=1 Tax=Parastrongyloides trichosuri TaxID=131310 RepID=A0A0N4ZFT3_PARTI
MSCDDRPRVYLDGAGAGIPSRWLIEEIKKIDFMELGNPHTSSFRSQSTGNRINQVRNRILNHFNVTSSEYNVVFTSGTTGSLKLLGECFDFNPPTYTYKKESSTFDPRGVNETYLSFLQDSHTSVIGLKNIVNCSSIICNNYNYFNSYFSNPNNDNPLSSGNNLFILTGMSNSCGKKYDLNIIKKIINFKNWYVCIDGASLLSNEKIDLKKFNADGVVGSFYKIFGLPTGLGFLIVSRRIIDKMNRKSYFGGGTVNFMICNGLIKKKDDFVERMEDGTCNFQGIIMLEKCFDEIKNIESIENVGRKVFNLSKIAYDKLRSLKYDNGVPLVRIYGWNEVTFETQGPIINFNLQRDDESIIGYNEVSKMSELFDIDLRVGCFCNIGSCISYLNLSREDIKNFYYNGDKKCGDKIDIVNGQPLGSVRISFGKWNTINDVSKLIKMLQYCFIKGSKIRKYIPEMVSSSIMVRILRLFLYPVKSGSYLEVDKWNVTEKGMVNDRIMLVIDKNGIPVTQKMIPAMCLIKCIFDKNGNLIIKDKNKELDDLIVLEDDNMNKEEIMVCSDNRCSYVIGYNEWLAKLHPSFGDESKFIKIFPENEHSYVNEAPFLIINLSSVRLVAETLDLDIENILHRFRSNIVLDLGEPFIERKVKEIHFCNNIILQKVSDCHRCQMICVDQESGEKNVNLMITLRDIQEGNKLIFGIYMKMKGNVNSTIHKGEEVVVFFD